MSEYSAVGKRLPRIEASIKATGEARYCDDLIPPKMLYGKILWSPYAHAKILHIDTSNAQRLPGVKAVVTGEDSPKIKYGALPVTTQFVDEFLIGVDKVRYIGEAVAAVAAVDEDTAEEALDLIRVEYEELPAVFDPEEAMSPGSPKIHDVENNISFKATMSFGNLEKAFKESDLIQEDRFTTQSMIHASLETHTCVAHFEDADRLIFWASKQSPFRIRYYLSMVLGMPLDKIRVIKPHLGSGFGGKGELIPVDYCTVLLAKKAARPVKIASTREEVFQSTNGRHPMIVQLKTGIKNDGTLTAQDVRLILDGGAYTRLGPITTYLAASFFVLPYRIRNLKLEGFRVYTNKLPCGAMRGHGTVQTRFAYESQLDMIAEKLSIDPVELRLKNAVKSGEVAVNKMEVKSCGFSECLQRGAESSGWQEKRGKLPFGKGIGTGGMGFVSGAGFHLFPTTAALSSAQMDAYDDGRVTLTTGACDIGQGSDSIIVQIAAEELGISPKDIRIVTGDTAITPIDWGTGSSRVTLMAGNAAKRAAADLKRQLLEAAAEKLEANPEDLDIKNGKIYVKGSPEKGMSFREAVVAKQITQDGKFVSGRGSYQSGLERPSFATGEGNISPTYVFAAQTALVEVDKETGMVKFIRMDAAHDCGFAINPMNVEGQLEGSVAMGMGYALSEEMIRDRGQILNPSLLDYNMATSMDVPEVVSIIVESQDPVGPFGAKEAGEGTTIPTAPAIANAIWDAVGTRIKDLPITPEKILQAMEEGRTPLS